MVRGIVQGPQNVTTTDSLKRDKGFRCMTCGRFAAVARPDAYGRPICDDCAGGPGLVRVVGDPRRAGPEK